MIYIYGLFDPRTKELKYIGKTKDTLKNRLQYHLYPVALKPITLKNNWLKSLLKQGLKPHITPLQETTEDRWQIDEQENIKHWKMMGCPLTNGTDGGEGLLNYKTSEETKRKISKALSGRPHSLEWNKKVSLSHIGKKVHSEVVRDKIGSFFRKLNNKQIYSVKWLSSIGVKQKEICNIYHINRRTLYRILYDKMRYSKFL